MRIPLATYRFQFNKDFTFEYARTLLAYLRDLGISDVYASPIFLATPGSTHGYDICRFDRINPDLGGAEEFDRLVSEIQRLGMGLLLDMVPNHMGCNTHNLWWLDVLKNGRKSECADFFDINWNPPNPQLQDKVLLPVLGDHYGVVLERGELKVGYDNGQFHLAYFDKHFPLSPESEKSFELGQIKDSERTQFLADLNGEPGRPASFDRLQKLLDQQHYRIAYWRVAQHEINYRRFFDVTELVSVRVEDRKVFSASHELLLDYLHSRKITGLRIDHPDGLRDPKAYFDRLQTFGETQPSVSKTHYVLAEKILSDDERIPDDWPIHGTTGYDYLNYLNGLFVKQEAEAAFTRIYSQFTDSAEDFQAIAYRSKKDALNKLFIAEVNALTRRLKALASSTRMGRDFTEIELRTAIIDFTAGFPAYRTYVIPATQQLTPAEHEFIKVGLDEAKRRSGTRDVRAMEFLAQILGLQFPHDFDGAKQAEAREFIARFQQVSGPAIAKGLEDTAFYRYHRFVSINEVGGNPGRFGISTEEFHAHNTAMQEAWPHSMLTSATHDTKRGEDTRARLNVLSEIPEEWEAKVTEWRKLNETSKRNSAPSAADEYLLYQVLVGTWTGGADLTAYIERLQNYLVKATREAKTHTSWTEPNEAYEQGTKDFVASILNSLKFRNTLSGFTQQVAYFGMFNSLAQVVLKSCSPGVPDFYRGTELWDLTLVDPDNRRPVDYALRQRLLTETRKPKLTDLLKEWQIGAVKLSTTANCLRIRREQSAIVNGKYQPVRIFGPKSNHIIAFARTTDTSTVIIAVPRFLQTLTSGRQELPAPAIWGDTRLDYPGNRFQNLLTGERVSELSAANIFATFPAAILATQPG
jgi:(1->4)-alpha-D-glucan 1-alpha-D-glucosylmutase